MSVGLPPKLPQDILDRIESNRQKAKIRRHNIQRLAMQASTLIEIPKPLYKTGSNMRSRFAFGKISAAQARANTARQLESG